MYSLRGTCQRGGKGKTKTLVKHTSVREGDACEDAIVFSFRPLIKYAKPTQLWNVWLSKLSNQNHATFFGSSLWTPTGSRISCFFACYFLLEKIT